MQRPSKLEDGCHSAISWSQLVLLFLQIFLSELILIQEILIMCGFKKKYEMCFWGFVKNIMWLDSNWIGTYGIIIIIARYIKPLFDLAGDLSPHSSIEEMCVSFLRGVATPGLPIHGAPWILSGTPRCPRKNCSGI